MLAALVLTRRRGGGEGQLQLWLPEPLLLTTSGDGLALPAQVAERCNQAWSPPAGVQSFPTGPKPRPCVPISELCKDLPGLPSVLCPEQWQGRAGKSLSTRTWFPGSEA